MYNTLLYRMMIREKILYFAKKDRIKPCLWLTKIRRVVLQLVKIRRQNRTDECRVTVELARTISNYWRTTFYFSNLSELQSKLAYLNVNTTIATDVSCTVNRVYV